MTSGKSYYWFFDEITKQNGISRIVHDFGVYALLFFSPLEIPSQWNNLNFVLICKSVWKIVHPTTKKANFCDFVI